MRHRHGENELKTLLTTQALCKKPKNKTRQLAGLYGSELLIIKYQVPVFFSLLELSVSYV